jgi:hypothetical protein
MTSLTCNRQGNDPLGRFAQARDPACTPNLKWDFQFEFSALRGPQTNPAGEDELES